MIDLKWFGLEATVTTDSMKRKQILRNDSRRFELISISKTINGVHYSDRVPIKSRQTSVDRILN